VITGKLQTGTQSWSLFLSKTGRRGNGRSTNTGLKIGFLWFSKMQLESWLHAVKTNWSRDGQRTNSDNLRGCRLQDRGALQGRSESRQYVVAHRRSGREAQLARGGLGVVAFWWLVDGQVKAQGRGQGWLAVACHHHHVFVRIYLCISAFGLDG